MFIQAVELARGVVDDEQIAMPSVAPLSAVEEGLIAFNEAVVKEQYPDNYRAMKSTGVDFDKVTSLELGFGYLSAEELTAADK